MPNESHWRGVSARERLDELYRRLPMLERAESAEEAFRQLCETLDQVEDELRNFESAAEQLRQLVGEVKDQALPKPSMNLVVIYARDIELAKEFYDALGLSFASEQHGSGPRHYAALMGSLVFEIYPCRTGEGTSPLRFGFRVPSVDGTVEALRSRGVKIVADPKDSSWGRRAVVEDPDGNRVELAQ